MSKKILVKTTRDPFLFQWVELPMLGFPASARREIGTLAELSEELASKGNALIYFLAPATSVMVKQVSFEAAERKHLAKTIPYTLEEEMICDASELHCVMAKPSKDALWVAAVQKQELDHWLARFAEANLQLIECIPEQTLLLQQDAEWAMYFENDEFLLRHNDNQLHGVDAQNIGLALELATDGFGELPKSIALFVNEESDRQAALDAIPEPLKHIINTRIKPLPALVNQRLGVAHELNLLQGDYRISKAWDGVFSKWKGLLALLLAALTVHVGVSFAEYAQLGKKVKSTQQQTEAFCKQVLPKCTSKIAVRKQLEGELRRLGGGAGEGFLQRLDAVSTALKTQENFKINTLSYDAVKSAAELDVLLKDFPAVEKLKESMSSKRLEATLINTNAQGDQIRARLSVKNES